MSQQVSDGNVAARLRLVTSLAPGAIAIAEPDGPPTADGSRSYALTTFGNLNERSDAIAQGLLAWGVRPGMRLAMLVPFGTLWREALPMDLALFTRGGGGGGGALRFAPFDDDLDFFVNEAFFDDALASEEGALDASLPAAPIFSMDLIFRRAF